MELLVELGLAGLVVMGGLVWETDYSELVEGNDASQAADWAHHIQPDRAV